MPNAGYPDDDGSRTASGQHDLGRQRVNCYPELTTLICPTNIGAVIARDGDFLNDPNDNNGRQRTCGNVPVDGDSNSNGHRYVPAAYPFQPATNE